MLWVIWNQQNNFIPNNFLKKPQSLAHVMFSMLFNKHRGRPFVRDRQTQEKEEQTDKTHTTDKLEAGQ